MSAGYQARSVLLKGVTVNAETKVICEFAINNEMREGLILDVYLGRASINGVDSISLSDSTGYGLWTAVKSGGSFATSSDFTPTADHTTSTFTRNGHGLAEGTLVSIEGGTLPGGLAPLTKWYIRNPTTNTFQLSAIPAGAPVGFTSNGSGFTISVVAIVSLRLNPVTDAAVLPLRPRAQLSATADNSAPDAFSIVDVRVGYCY